MGKIMTLPQVAEYLQFAISTIQKKVAKGELPAVKIGKEWRFPQDVIDKWLEEESKHPLKQITKKSKAQLKPGSYKGKVIGSLRREDIYNDR